MTRYVWRCLCSLTRQHRSLLRPTGAVGTLVGTARSTSTRTGGVLTALSATSLARPRVSVNPLLGYVVVQVAALAVLQEASQKHRHVVRATGGIGCLTAEQRIGIVQKLTEMSRVKRHVQSNQALQSRQAHISMWVRKESNQRIMRCTGLEAGERPDKMDADRPVLRPEAKVGSVSFVVPLAQQSLHITLSPQAREYHVTEGTNVLFGANKRLQGHEVEVSDTDFCHLHNAPGTIFWRPD
jgi:hypothetical protein